MPINFHFGLGHLMSSAGHDPLLSGPIRAKLGDTLFWKDMLGDRYFRYVRSTAAAAMPAGSLVSMFGDTNGLTAVTVVLGSTVHATAAGLTAGAFEGGHFYVTNKAAVAGGAPEGEVAIVRNNSTTRIDCDDRFPPLSVALAVNDTLAVKSKHTATLSATGDFNRTVLGVPLVDVAVGDYFWAQYKGPARVIVEDAITTAIGTQMMTGATAGKADGVAAGSALNLVIGESLFAIAVNDLVNDFGWIDLAVGEARKSGSTLDATA